MKRLWRRRREFQSSLSYWELRKINPEFFFSFFFLFFFWGGAKIIVVVMCKLKYTSNMTPKATCTLWVSSASGWTRGSPMLHSYLSSCNYSIYVENWALFFAVCVPCAKRQKKPNKLRFVANGYSRAPHVTRYYYHEIIQVRKVISTTLFYKSS